MTDVFNIDHEVEGFRRNTLDWRKLRDSYNKISISKLERGIKPLPLPLLLKLFGPQKVLNTYIVSRRVTNEVDYYTANATSDTYKIESEMRDKAVPRPLNFPGNTVLINSFNTEYGFSVVKSISKTGKYDALPSRPVFQRNSHVPGRYFPKPPASEELSIHSKSVSDSMSERPRTLTPRSIYTPKNPPNSRGSSSRPLKSSTSHVRRNAGIIKGSVCKATETTSRPSSFSTIKSSSTVRSAASALSSDRLLISRKPISVPGQDAEKADLFSISFRNEEPEQGTTAVNGSYDPKSELHSDYYTVKRLRLSARQVSFPKSSVDFRPVLQGKTKTLHRRENPDSTEVPSSMKERRSKTHVGFVDDGD